MPTKSGYSHTGNRKVSDFERGTPVDFHENTGFSRIRLDLVAVRVILRGSPLNLWRASYTCKNVIKYKQQVL